LSQRVHDANTKEQQARTVPKSVACRPLSGMVTASARPPARHRRHEKGPTGCELFPPFSQPPSSSSLPAPLPRRLVLTFRGVWVSVTPEVRDLQKIEVKQDAATLVETRGDGGEDHTLTYKLDRSQMRVAIP
jgi:hypothetical protein